MNQSEHELSNLDLKCKNHVYISDHANTKTLGGGMYAYGQFAKAYLYLIHFPKLFLHQIVCPDNPVLHMKSNELYEKYDSKLYNPYKTAEKMVMTIHIVKTKTKAIIGI